MRAIFLPTPLVNDCRASTIARQTSENRLTIRMLDYHLVLSVLVLLILFVLVAAATVRCAVLLILGNVRHIGVDALGV